MRSLKSTVLLGSLALFSSFFRRLGKVGTLINSIVLGLLRTTKNLYPGLYTSGLFSSTQDKPGMEREGNFSAIINFPSLSESVSLTANKPLTAPPGPVVTLSQDLTTTAPSMGLPVSLSRITPFHAKKAKVSEDRAKTTLTARNKIEKTRKDCLRIRFTPPIGRIIEMITKAESKAKFA